MSLDVQRERIVAYCKMFQHNLIAIYADDHTGRNLPLRLLFLVPFPRPVAAAPAAEIDPADMGTAMGLDFCLDEPPPDVVAEAQTRANVDPGMAAGSYGMSNATRFTGAQGTGWTRRDSGDGGYSRTLGGDGGISAERINYDNQVMDNAFDIAANGGWWGEGVYIGGIGWGGRLGGD